MPDEIHEPLDPTSDDFTTQLEILMQNDPTMAQQILHVIEGGSIMPEPTPAPVPEPAPAPTPVSTSDPALMQQMKQMQQQLAHAQSLLGEVALDKDLNSLRGQHGKIREHFGDVLPEDFSALEKPVMQTMRDLMEGKLPPHEVAYKLAVLDQALQGEGALKDRLIAKAAQNNPPPTPEGKGGIPAPEPDKPKVYSTAAERVAALRRLAERAQAATAGS